MGDSLKHQIARKYKQLTYCRRNEKSAKNKEDRQKIKETKERLAEFKEKIKDFSKNIDNIKANLTKDLNVEQTELENLSEDVSTTNIEELETIHTAIWDMEMQIEEMMKKDGTKKRKEKCETITK